MRAFGTGTKACLLSSALLFSCPVIADSAQAAESGRYERDALKPTASYHPHAIGSRIAWDGKVSPTIRTAGMLGATRTYGVSCVPYARQVSGIQVAGNAWQWWENAKGLYARGDQPEVGSVLNFRSNGRMRLGHVAVVTRVVNPREVIVEHANWPSGGSLGRISHNVAVVDVSEANNWSAVRVELGRDTTFGSVYPTYGFIYNRPDPGVMIAGVAPPAPQAAINPVPSDLRPAAERPWRTVEEVAESPANQRDRINLSVTSAAVRNGR
jgi:surface antigen